MSPSKHVVISAITLIACLLVFEFTDLDMWVQSQIFDPASHTWALDKTNTMLHFLLYDGAKKLIVLFALGVLFSLVFLRSHRWVKEYRYGLMILLIALVVVPSVVGLLKATTNIACPKDIVDFGGVIPHVGVFGSYPESMRPAKIQRCFPAGHASGAFALMALYYLAKTRARRKQLLVFAIALGGITGGYKMLIGDHFLSHTLVSMILAWLLINVIVLTSGLLDTMSKKLLMLKAGRGKTNNSQADNVNEVL